MFPKALQFCENTRLNLTRKQGKLYLQIPATCCNALRLSWCIHSRKYDTCSTEINYFSSTCVVWCDHVIHHMIWCYLPRFYSFEEEKARTECMRSHVSFRYSEKNQVHVPHTHFTTSQAMNAILTWSQFLRIFPFIFRTGHIVHTNHTNCNTEGNVYLYLQACAWVCNDIRIYYTILPWFCHSNILLL